MLVVLGGRDRQLPPDQAEVSLQLVTALRPEATMQMFGRILTPQDILSWWIPGCASTAQADE
jgi:hypothetical protein